MVLVEQLYENGEKQGRYRLITPLDYTINYNPQMVLGKRDFYHVLQEHS